MELYNPSKHSEIKKVKAKFDMWRLNKNNRSEAVPDHLWEIVANLAQKYPIGVVFRQLNLNKDQGIRFFTKQYLAKANPIIHQIPIVEVPNPQINTESLAPKDDFKIVVQHTSGHKLNISGNQTLTLGAISAFVGNQV